MGEICRITKNNETIIITMDTKQYIVTEDNKHKASYSIAIEHNMSPDDLKKCNKHIETDAKGVMILHVNDKLYVNPKVKEVKVEAGDKRPKESNSSLCAPWMDVAWQEYKTFLDNKGQRMHESYPLFNEKIKLYHQAGSLKSDSKLSWCASFICWCLNEIHITNPASASSQFFINHSSLKKIDKPAYGAIAVFRNFHYVGKNEKEDFSIQKNDRTVSFTNGSIELVKINDVVDSISKNGNVIFESTQIDNKGNKSKHGHINFVVDLAKKKEGFVNCLGGNQDGGHISKNEYDCRKDKLYIAYGKTYRMFMGF